VDGGWPNGGAEYGAPAANDEIGEKHLRSVRRRIRSVRLQPD